MNLDRRLLRQIDAVKAILGLAAGASFLAGLAAVWQARLVSRVIAGVYLGGLTLSAVMPLLWALLAAVAARAVLSLLGEMGANSAARRVKERLRDQLARRLLELGPVYTQDERSGELVNTVTQGIEALDAYFSQYLPQLALAGLLPLAFLAIVFPLDPLSGVVLLLTGPLIPLFMFLIGSLAERLTRRQWAALSRMSAYFLDTLQGLATLKALGRSREQAGRIAQVSEQYRAATMSVLRVTFLSALVLELLSTMGTAIIAVEIGLRLLYGRLDFESAFFLLLLAPDFYLPLRALGLRFHASMAGVSAARRIFAVLEQPPPAENLPRPAAASSRAAFAAPFTITMEDVAYTYPNGENSDPRPPALDGVSLRAEAGQVTALVGASGAGKSTLAGLLLRFLEPQRGVISINDTPLAAIPAGAWRQQIAWVPQHPYLFQGTLADNLRIAYPAATLAEMRRAAQQARLLDWIESLPAGLDTPVGEGGAQISGGQAQRLALARAFLRDAPLLILDEPTAYLDVNQEQALVETIRQLCAGRTALVIAHRLSTIAAADQIVVLEAGRVAECGTHAALLARGGAYSRLLAAYSEGML